MTRNIVQQTASLHEKAVQAVALGEVQVKRSRAPRKPSKVQPTYASPLVDERVWAEARRILRSDHGYTNWEVINETEVIIR
jgi:hypothetical protein